MPPQSFTTLRRQLTPSSWPTTQAYRRQLTPSTFLSTTSRLPSHQHHHPAVSTIPEPQNPEMARPTDQRPIVISGPSGVGKGTLYGKLFAAHPDAFTLSVSHTTRAPRSGETHGVHYFFVSMEAFEALIADDGFVEHAKFGSNRYGTSKATIAEQAAKGRVTVLDIEMEGVKQIKKAGIPARFVFIAPPAPEVDTLRKRLEGRGSESAESLEKRLKQAEVELEYAKTPGVHDLIIVNDDLERAYKELEEFVFKPAEK